MGGVIPRLSVGYHSFEVFKRFNGFDEKYVPESYFYPYIIRALNPTQDYLSLVHKVLIDEIFSDLKCPETVLKSAGKNYITQNLSLINKKDIPAYLLSQNCDLMIKPAKDSNSGRGISLIERNTPVDKIIDIIENYPTHFVIQKIVKQSEFTSQFNPSSLNTFRVLTLLINGKFSICYTILKLGAPGRFVDNGANGGLWVGVNKDGVLKDWGTTFKAEFHKEHNGVILANKTVPNFDKIVSFAKKAHLHIPMCGLVGWDIALDSTNNPLLIEANMWWPGLSYGEICSGPAFGDRTLEVVDYCKSNKLDILGFNHKI